MGLADLGCQYGSETQEGRKSQELGEKKKKHNNSKCRMPSTFWVVPNT